jgi:hypothetical protein
MGVYESIRKIGASKKEDPAGVMKKLSESEYQHASDADRLFIVQIWCQLMRIRID